jgi:hypothetical protein
MGKYFTIDERGNKQKFFNDEQSAKIFNTFSLKFVLVEEDHKLSFLKISKIEKPAIFINFLSEDEKNYLSNKYFKCMWYELSEEELISIYNNEILSKGSSEQRTPLTYKMQLSKRIEHEKSKQNQN